MSEQRPTNDEPNPLASVPQRVTHEHRRLHDCVGQARTALRGTGDARRAMEGLFDATEAHFSREERLYYPTLWALRAELEQPLAALLSAHDGFRARLREIVRAQEGGDRRTALEQLEIFVELFAEHESAEDRVLASLASGRAPAV